MIEAMAANVAATACTRVAPIHPAVSEFLPTVFGALSGQGSWPKHGADRCLPTASDCSFRRQVFHSPQAQREREIYPIAPVRFLQ